MFRYLITLVVLFPLSAACFAGENTNLPPGVIMTQGKATITLDDVDTFAKTVPDDGAARLFSSPERIESILRNLSVTEQLAMEARDAGLADSPEVKAAIAMATSKALANAAVEQLRNRLEHEIPDLTALANERYLADPEKYATPARIDVKHILIGTKERDDAAAKALADKLYAQLQADPSSFDPDVMQYSDDASKAQNHGMIQNANGGNFVEPFKKAAAKLTKVGELTPPVKTRFGYHILKAVKVEPATQQSFADIKDALVKELQQDWVEKKVQHHVDALRGSAAEVNPELVASLRTRYAAKKSAEPDDAL